MTRLLTCGWEAGDVNEAGTSTIGANGSVAAVTSTPTPHSPGSYCLKVSNSVTNFTPSYQRFALAAAKAEIWVRFFVYIHVSGSQEAIIATSFDSAAAAQNCVSWSPVDSLIRARLSNSTATTLLATSSTAMTADTWHLFEWRIQITSTTAGVVEIWLDGTRIINFSGDNTQTTNANVQYVAVGLAAAAGVTVSAANAYLAYDDIAINDTSGTINNAQIGDGRVVLLKPNGAGSNTNQTRGGTDTGANYSQVNELPPSLTQYVYSATAGTRDTYTLEDAPTGTWSVNCAEVLAFAQNSDTGTGSLGLTVKSGVTTNEGTAQNLSASGAYYRQLYETDPNTSAAWTVAAVNALEAGTTVR